MIRWLPVMFLLASSGCADLGPDAEAGPSPSVPVASGTPASADAAPWWDVEYDLGGNLIFENEIQRFRLVAEGPVKVATASHVGLPPFGPGFHCLITAHHVGDDSDYVVPLWSQPWDQDRKSEVRLGGNSYGVPLDPPVPGATYTTMHSSSNGRVHDFVAGQEMLLDLGGDSATAIRDAGGEWVLRMAVQGPHRLERLPAAPLACGSDHSALEDSTVGASAAFASFEFGGSVAMSTRNASTLIVLVHHDGLGGEEVSASFLGREKAVTDEDVLASVPNAGDIELRFGRSARWGLSSIDPALSGFDNRHSYRWMMADIHWPIVERVAATRAASAP